MKIGLVGSVSVGKTTLIEALAKLPQFKDYKIATERSKYLRDLGIPLNTDSTLKGQMVFGAERASELFHDNLLTDRTIIDVMAFTNLATSMSLSQKYKFEMIGHELVSEYDYLFYISPVGVGLEDNSIRTTDPEYRIQIDQEIQKLISRCKSQIKNYHEIHGLTIEERVNFVKNIIGG